MNVAEPVELDPIPSEVEKERGMAAAEDSPLVSSHWYVMGFGEGIKKSSWRSIQRFDCDSCSMKSAFICVHYVACGIDLNELGAAGETVARLIKGDSLTNLCSAEERACRWSCGRIIDDA
jgi:hypothetical protein